MRIMFFHDAVEICDPKNNNELKVNGQRLKSFLESVPKNETTICMFDPMY